MSSDSDMLDPDELFHLGIKASESGNHEESINYLKRSIQKAESPSAKAHYVLAAEHAEIGMYERAIEEMEAALAIDEALWTASFQLGLLYLMLNKKSDAVARWEHLLRLPNDDALHLFGAGMIELASGRVSDAKELLRAGLRANTSNPALNQDIERILSNINDAEDGDTKTEGRGDSHLFISAYDTDKQ